MDFLKRLTGIIVILLTVTGIGMAQDQQTLLAAFSASYKAEGEGDYTKAANTLKNVFNKNSYEINLRLGWLSYKAGLFDESESYYQRAMQLMPYGIEARFGLIYPLASKGKWDQVIQHYQEILKIDPQNGLANYRLGLVYYGREEYADAESLFTKVVNLWPFEYDGLHMLAWTMLRLGKNSGGKSLVQ